MGLAMVGLALPATGCVVSARQRYPEVDLWLGHLRTGFLIEQRLAYKPRGWSWVLSADSKLDSYEDPM